MMTGSHIAVRWFAGLLKTDLRNLFRKGRNLAIVIIIYLFWNTSNYHKLLSLDSKSAAHSSSVVETGSSTIDIANNTIRLVSYNLCCNYISRSPLKASCQERLSSFIAQSKDSDILLLQEVFVMQFGPFYFHGNVGFLIQEAVKESFLYKHSLLDSLGHFFLAQNNGLVSLSKFPVRASKSVRFTCSGIREYPTCKGYAILEVPVRGKDPKGRSLYLFNVHLDAHSSGTRECQLEELSALVKDLPVDAYIVISGDLNVDALKGDGREYLATKRIMGSVGLQEVFQRDDATFFDGSHFDHTFISENIAVIKRDVRNLFVSSSEQVSDHFGLFMNLKLLE